MSADTPARRPGRLLLAILPLAIFGLLAVAFLAQLYSGRDLSAIPSALIGEAAPTTKLPPLEGSNLPGLDSDRFRGRVTVVNVWASWCGPCREEHPVLIALSKDKRFDLEGLNYKDAPKNALAFLGELGSPYSAVGVDTSGRTAIDWGVYGVPETYVVDRAGLIRYRHVGPLSEEAVNALLLPEIEKALAG
jgi:cytochrome c biogenesis protein CcmG/thiol:disulfide interchange protein DsbE